MNKPTRYEPPLAEHLFTVDDVFKMVDAGILRDEDDVELIEGRLIRMAPEGPLHMRAVARLTKALVIAIAGDPALAVKFEVSPHGTLVMGPRTYLIPDLMVAAPLDGKTPVTPDLVSLAVEAAQSSQDYDLGLKRDLYAEAGVVEHWVLDAVARQLHVGRRPKDGAYQETLTIEGNGVASPFFAPTIAFKIADFL